MNKVIVVMLCIIVIIGAIFTAMFIFKQDKNEEPKTSVTKVSEENIIDECTEEYEEMKNENILETNSEEVKTSPNCAIILKKYYTKCGHTLTEYTNLPNDLVNSTEEKIQEVYQGWSIESFVPNQIVLFRNIESECGEHYLVKDENGKVAIYRILENGNEALYENTEISTEYLPDVDKINMKTGIRANGKEELNQVLEDFE